MPTMGRHESGTHQQSGMDGDGAQSVTVKQSASCRIRENRVIAFSCIPTCDPHQSILDRSIQFSQIVFIH